MAKARWVKPEFFTDEKLCSVSERAGLVFEALWTEADDGGVAPGDPDLIYGRCFIKRREWTTATVEACFTELEGIGVVRQGVHRGKRWILIPMLMEHQGTKPKDWRHLGKVEHPRLVKEIFREKRRKAAQSGAPSHCTPKQLLEPKQEPEPKAVAEAGSVLRTEATPQPEQAAWDNREAAKQIRAICYVPDGKPPAGTDIAEDLRFWKRCLAAGQSDGRIIAALHGLPHVMHTGGKWSPARVFGKRGDWVSLFERAVTEDGKHGRPSHLAAELQRLSTPPIGQGVA